MKIGQRDKRGVIWTPARESAIRRALRAKHNKHVAKKRQMSHNNTVDGAIRTAVRDEVQIQIKELVRKLTS